MKKNRLLILTLLVLIALTTYFVFNKSNSTIDEGLRDFAFADTASITKLFLADRTGSQVTLERKGPGDWRLSDGSEVRTDAVNTLLVCIKDISVRSPVAKAAYNNVVKAIATKGLKIEIYTAKGLVKTYYVGGPSQDQMGTFMHLEGSSVPFVTHIPGFNGYLTPRYITRASEWKTHRIFNYEPDEIGVVSVVDRTREGYEFRIENDNKGNFMLFGPGGQPVEGVVQDRIISYLQFYKAINYESEEKSLSSFQRDSMLATVPMREILVTGLNGTSKLIKIWRRPQTESTQNKTNAAGEPFPFDIDRMTAMVDGDSTLIVVQYFMFDKLMRKPSDFVVSGK